MENPNMKVGFPGLGSALRAARQKADMSQEDVGEEIGVSWMTVLRWEGEKRAISLSHLRQLETLYDVGEFVPDVDAAIRIFCIGLKKAYWRQDIGWTTNVVECIDSIIEA